MDMSIKSISEHLEYTFWQIHQFQGTIFVITVVSPAFCITFAIGTNMDGQERIARRPCRYCKFRDGGQSAKLFLQSRLVYQISDETISIPWIRFSIFRGRYTPRRNIAQSARRYESI